MDKQNIVQHDSIDERRRYMIHTVCMYSLQYDITLNMTPLRQTYRIIYSQYIKLITRVIWHDRNAINLNGLAWFSPIRPSSTRMTPCVVMDWRLSCHTRGSPLDLFNVHTSLTLCFCPSVQPCSVFRRHQTGQSRLLIIIIYTVITR